MKHMKQLLAEHGESEADSVKDEEVWGIQVGYHREGTKRSYKTSYPWHYDLNKKGFFLCGIDIHSLLYSLYSFMSAFYRCIFELYQFFHFYALFFDRLIAYQLGNTVTSLRTSMKFSASLFNKL